MSVRGLAVLVVMGADSAQHRVFSFASHLLSEIAPAAFHAPAHNVAPRIGGTNVHMSVGHPYGNTLWRKNMSTGRRLAFEVRRAFEMERLDEIVT